MSELANVLIEALNDEYKARAVYQYVIDTFGPVRPFINIVEAEGRHINALLPLFHRYGIPVPPDTWKERIAKPESIADACRMGGEAEIENAEMYDRLLKAAAGYPDVQRVMISLQRASAENHLPAFRRCAARSAGLKEAAKVNTGRGVQAGGGCGCRRGGGGFRGRQCK